MTVGGKWIKNECADRTLSPALVFFVPPPPPTSPLKVGSVIWNRAGKYKAQRITEMGKEIEKGERERRSFEHVAVRSITNVRVGGRGCFCSCSFLLHERRDSSFSSFSSTTCSLDGFRMAMGGWGGEILS